MPLDPIETDTGESPRNTPEFLDENPNRDMIMEGMNESEEERREAADDEFGLDPSLPVDAEISDEEEDVASEVAAMHEFLPPN
jgi:hypothetical protein